MAKIIEIPFATMPGIVQRGTVATLCMISSLLFVASDCKKPEKPEEPKEFENQSIIGSWKVVQVRYPCNDFSVEPTVVNYSDSAVVFTFKENHKLELSGNIEIPGVRETGHFPEGEYDYEYHVLYMTKSKMGYDCGTTTTPLRSPVPKSSPAPNLHINDMLFFARVSEQATELGIVDLSQQWDMHLTKIK